MVMTLSSCVGSPAAAPAPPLPTNRLDVQIDLSATQVAAGHPLKGVLVVYNPHAAINLNHSKGAHGCKPSFAVTLSNGTIRNGVAFTMECTNEPLHYQARDESASLYSGYPVQQLHSQRRPERWPSDRVSTSLPPIGSAPDTANWFLPSHSFVVPAAAALADSSTSDG